MRSFASVLLAATVGAQDAPVDSEEALRRELAAALDDPALGAVKVSALVADVESGRVLFARQEGQGLIPASAVKLATTTAALASLGPEFRFRTEILGKHQAGAEEVKGDLHLRGFGDPTLVTESLHVLAQRLRAAGIRRVERGLIVDNGYFEPPAAEGPDERPDADAPYRAPPAAVSLNYNAMRVVVSPGAAEGTPARVMIFPNSWYFTVTGNVNTVARGPNRVRLQIVARDERTELVVSGKVRLASPPITLRRRVPHPALYTGRTLLAVLARNGIQVARPNLRVGPTPDDLAVLATHESEPLAALIRDVNKLSNNVMADQVLMALGAERVEPPGTFAKGLEVVGQHLEAIGIPREWFHLASGSGLERDTRLNAAALVRMLRAAAHDFRYAADLQASLAVAGADGTLRRRFTDSPAARYVRGKTGTLAGVIALSGYAGGPGRKMLAFAVLINGVPRAAGRHAADRFAAALVEYLRR